MIFENIPRELLVLPHWIRWTYAGEKRTKVPITVSGSPASTTDPSTWTIFDKVRGFDKIGFVFTEDSKILGIDLDHVLNENTLCVWAESIVRAANSYCELSPSGTGLHILGIGMIPDWMPNRTDMPDNSGLETYNHGRYFTMTGKVYRDYSHLSEIDIAKVLDFLRPQPMQPKEKKLAVTNSDKFDVRVDSIVPGIREEQNLRHPYHDSSTGANFRVDAGGETWRCWRHGVTGNALHLLGIREGIIQCGDSPSKEQWREILKVAKAEGLINERERIAAIPSGKVRRSL